MKKWKQVGAAALAAMAAALVMTACNNDGSNLNDPSSDVSGSWLYSDTGNNQTTWALVQEDDGTIDGAGTDGANIDGRLSNDDIQLTLTYAGGATSSLDGTVETNVMTGTFTNSSAGSGSWSAVKTN